jgi:hypothetical protein
MPKAGIEPARGFAPLDFESSASPSSATSACFIAGTAYRQWLAAWLGPGNNCPPKAAAQPGESLRLRKGRANGDNGKSGD